MNKIQELLDEQHMRPTTFAKNAGVSQSTLAEILSGKRNFDRVGVSKVIAMARAFGVTVEYLSGEEGVPKYPTTESFEPLSAIFSQLNDEGRSKLIEYADDLVSTGKYSRVDA